MNDPHLKLKLDYALYLLDQIEIAEQKPKPLNELKKLKVKIENL